MLSFPFNSSSTVMWYNKDAFKKAGLDPDKPPKTWPEVFEAAKKLKAAGHATCGFSQRLGHLGQPRAALGLAQRAARHQGERPRRLRHRAEVQRPAARQAPADPGRAAEGQDLRLLGPHQHRRRPLHLGRMPDLPDLVGVLRQRQGERQVRLRPLRRCRTIPDVAGRAAELDHRRRLAVGDGRQEARGIQGRRQVLHLPVRHRPPGRAAQGVGLPADHQGGLREDQGVGLLRGEPGSARRRCSS